MEKRKMSVIGNILLHTGSIRDVSGDTKIRMLNPCGFFIVTVILIIIPIASMFEETTVFMYYMDFKKQLCWW